ncbi:MAG: 50S ribosomal protein L21 [Chloroflexi bacterium]|nr:MAG: 50S ribosomal protein L21 [Chloroflexota bacterium]
MYAVLMTGGKQYRVEAGSTLVVEKVGGEPGSSVTFDRILLVGDGDAVTVGNPTIAGASVSATVLGEALGPKIVVFKFKQKVKYRRRTGHRQHMTRLHIDSISADGKTVKAEAPEPKPKAPAPEATQTRARRSAASAEAKPSRRRAAKAESERPVVPETPPSRSTPRRRARRPRRMQRPPRRHHRSRRQASPPHAGRPSRRRTRPSRPRRTNSDGTQEGRLIQQERTRQRRATARRQARRRAAG